MHEPKTIEEARAKRYGVWAGSAGEPYDESRCAEEVSDNDSRFPHFYQCSRRPGHGLAGLYCKAHARQYEEATLTWWRMSGSGKPVCTKIQSFTNDMVMVGGRSEKRHNFSYNVHWFETFAKARDWALDSAKSRLAEAEYHVQSARADIAEIEAWTEPAEAVDGK